MTLVRPQRLVLSFVLLFSTIFTVHYFAQGVHLRVSENACRLQFEQSNTQASLALENLTGRTLPAQIRLELLDTNNRVRARTFREEAIKTGRSTRSLALAETEVIASTTDKLWWRLHYVITPLDASLTPLEGFISASEITPDIFDLQVFAATDARAGMRYQARVRTAHPITDQSVSGVNISALAKYELNQKEQALKASAITNQDGYAVVTFDLPKDFGEDDSHNVEIKFTAKKGGLQHVEEIDLNLLQTDTYIVTTDKSLYQPGQTIHTRVVIFDQQRRARSDYEIEAVIEDAEEQKAFRTKLKTSKFGVASFDWKIPESTKLGGYKITIGTPSPTKAWGETYVKVSRYDLPTFAVNVKPNQSFYLPGENAEVEVNADYLFGQPVARGTVKIVREAERSWNYKTAKYDIEEGETDASGKFIAKIDLKERHKSFEPSDYRKFEDLHFAAYFTDTTTGRTEQRKFDLRLTKDPIHVYWIGDYDYGVNEPINGYINATYADGTPAQCEVTILQKVDDDDSIKEVQKKLTVLSTNKYGLAKVTGLRCIKDADDSLTIAKLIFDARNSQNKTGKLEKEITIGDRPIIRVSTDKSLYRAGESINATINSSDSSARVVLEVLQDNRVVTSQMLTLKQGSASITIPHRPELKDDVTLIAYANVIDDEDTKFVYAARAVLFPRDRELKVEVKMPRVEYQPGEEARAELLVKTADGKPANSALGISIVDTAVATRERSDNDFRGRQNYYGYYYGDASIAGLTRRDLDKLDPKQPFPTELDLVAEALLKNSVNDHIENHHDSQYDKTPHNFFTAYFEEQFRPIKSVLEREYNANGVYPKDLTTLRNLLRRINLDPEELRDPWGMPYHIGFLTNGNKDDMALLCAGADKEFNTNDDFMVLNISRLYFKFTGEAINRAVANYQARNGDYIRDAATLKSELKQAGIDFDALLDPWGTPYHISLRKNYDGFSLVVRSAGPDQKLEIEKLYGNDDVEVWAARLDYFSDISYRINQALDAYEKTMRTAPMDEAQFRAAMQRGGVDFDALRDPLGHRFYATISTQSYFVDKNEIITYSRFGEKPQDKTKATPITQTHIRIALRGAGEDGKEGTADDYNVTTFSRVLTEQASTDRAPVPNNKEERKATNTASLLPSGQSGALTGTVTDASGAVIPNTTIIAKNKTATMEHSARSNDNGVYFFRGLPPGLYDLHVAMPGFKKHVVLDVVIAVARTVIVDVRLEVGAVTEAVAITGEAMTLQTTSASMSSVVVKQVQSLPLNERNSLGLAKLEPGATSQARISTPRLREYFPETLLWQPNLETDAQGRAQLQFKLADNITTWKLSLIASTIDGQIGTAETDIRAFQPFFAELDPPKVLTEGDEIALPVVLRNYLEKSQTVDLQFKSESWFTLLSPARKQSVVKANDSAKEVFDFRAIASIKDGKQRVTAIGSTNSDAIEKMVNVHPDGEELALTAGNVFGAAGALDINVPADAIKGSVRAELKIYPNLLAHVTEGIEGILQRPYGCGEQTISSTYPNVMALRLLKSTGQGEEGRSAAIAHKARKFAQAGYERLLGYRTASGGFGYWSKGEADLALTAYALRFLHDASEVLEVNDDVMDDAQTWLLKQQRDDGSWSANRYYGKDNARQSIMSTALIVRALTAGGALPKADDKAVQKSLAFLTANLAEFSEPYALANYVIAAQQAGDKVRANWAVEKLRTLPSDEAGGVYWALETNTPFYGWGLAGRIETTALVLKALNQTTERPEKKEGNSSGVKNSVNAASPQSPSVSSVRSVVNSQELISKGVYWLLRNKDRYGVWLSTQATINVLDAFISLNDSTKASGETTAEIQLNGQRVNTITMPPSNELSNPIVVDLTAQLSTGNNRIEIKRPSGAALASAQLVETYYLPWSKSLATTSENVKPGEKRALRLAVNYDQPEAKIGEEITCRVEAERIGFAGYGMMLAEIGLPPGADVDRASLELAASKSGFDINHYDVLPDRVIFYLWPRAGGCKFSFKFRSRFGTKAQSSASILYDYYNPEARAVVAPTRFVVQ
jgi:A-macroglobulin TED domain/Alpha-2-macroglobulin family/Carboxypeptidase regulatory-like domain/MG2 domain/Alpha-2-macroglobulin bait region domain/A-macroglobulin receptor binding domain/Macroglobulin domain MG3